LLEDILKRVVTEFTPDLLYLGLDSWIRIAPVALTGIRTAFLILYPFMELWTSTVAFSLVGEHVTNIINELQDPRCPLNRIIQAKLQDPTAIEFQESKILMDFYFDKIMPKVCQSNIEPNREGLETVGVRKDVKWITLVFRMVCWLIVHDFDPEDIQIIPSKLRYSKAPVYIG
jgi:hypothetical protein